MTAVSKPVLSTSIATVGPVGYEKYRRAMYVMNSVGVRFFSHSHSGAYWKLLA